MDTAGERIFARVTQLGAVVLGVVARELAAQELELPSPDRDAAALVLGAVALDGSQRAVGGAEGALGGVEQAGSRDGEILASGLDCL